MQITNITSVYPLACTSDAIPNTLRQRTKRHDYVPAIKQLYIDIKRHQLAGESDKTVYTKTLLKTLRRKTTEHFFQL